MKKNLVYFAVAALAGVLIFAPTGLKAQNTPPVGAPPGAQNGPPGALRPRPRGGLSYRGVIRNLQMAKTQLERDKHDYDGHRQSAIDACNTAIAELQAVQKSIDEARAAAAAKAAAEQEQTNQPPASTAPAASPMAPQ